MTAIRMTPILYNYAKVMYDLGIPPECIQETKRRYELTKDLPRILNSPNISKEKKHILVEKIFPKEIISVLKILCDYQSIQLLPQILDAYSLVYQEEKDILGVSLLYVTEPTQDQLEKMLEVLRKRFGGKKVQIRMQECPELVGGFIIRVGDYEMDWSLRGRFRMLEQRLTRR